MTQTPPPPAAPPTLPDELAMPKRDSVWPGLVGGIALAFGVLGVLFYGVCGIGSQLLTGSVLAAMDAPGADAQLRMLEQYKWLNIASNLLHTLVAALLIVAGAMIVMRKPRCRSVVFVWVWAKFVAVIVGSFASYLAQRAMFDEQVAVQQPVMIKMQYVMLVLGVLWALALPVFMLIWFNRRAVRDEVAGWN